MKRIIFAIIFLLVASPVFSANYFAHKSGNINDDDVWFDDPAAGNGVTGATALAGTHTLYANGYTITIPNTANATFTAALISNKNDNGATDGGQFQYVTSADYAVVLQASIETGGTTGACLHISGSANVNPAFTIGSSGTPVTITGGSATGMHGVTDSHIKGTVVVYGSLTGGSNNTAHGYYFSGATGSIAVVGTATGGAAANSKGLIVIYSTSSISSTSAGANACVAGGYTGYAGAFGCLASGTGVMTVTGNIVNSARDVGAAGSIAWTPRAGDYIKTGAGTAVYVGLPPAGNKVLTTGSYINSASGTLTAGSATTGGAWLF